MNVTYGLDEMPHCGESRPRIASIKTYLLTIKPNQPIVQKWNMLKSVQVHCNL